jgi:hypothetical protein
MAEHPNKHIREAIEYAQKMGWRLLKAGPRAHVWGQLFCPFARRGGCIIRVFSTPRNPENMLEGSAKRPTVVPIHKPE